MKIRKAFRFRLKADSDLEAHFQRVAGCCRFVWNKAWAMNRFRLENRLPLVGYQEFAWFLTLWKQSEEYRFLLEAPSQALQQTLKHLERAIQDGFDKKQPLKRLPRFKKKGLHDSFQYPQGFKFEGNKIFLPKVGWVRFFKSRSIEGVPKNVTVSRKGTRWFVSIQVEQELPEPKHPSLSQVGIDMGISDFAALSTGARIEPLNSFRKLEKKLAKTQSDLSRKKRFSENWKKTQQTVSKIHIQIANARNDFLHKVSTEISKNHAVIVLEDLKITNMSASARGTQEKPGFNVKTKSGLNKAILDQGWFEFRRQLNYKLSWLGGTVGLVDPKNTSRECRCGHIAAENRNGKQFKCVVCGYTEDADVNAAKNILGRFVGGRADRVSLWRDPVGDSVKQEPLGHREVRPALV